MNIRGTFNVFEAAAGGLPPSSSPPAPHAIGFYRVGQQIGTDVPVRPDTY